MKKLITCFLLFLTFHVAAQKASNPFSKFGNVTVENLKVKTYPIDSSANAVILSDIGDYSIVGNSVGWFDLKIVHHSVIHILNKNGYDAATVEISLHSKEEKVMNFKAVTYNLENGKVKKSKLSKHDLVKQKVDNEESMVKFTMPDLQPGSIIEYTFTTYTNSLTFPPTWYFQSLHAPTLRSELTFSIPKFFHYSTRASGIGYDIQRSTSKSSQRFRIRGLHGTAANFSNTVIKHQYISKNIPRLRKEPYTRSLGNFISRLKFQLISQSQPLPPKTYRVTWQKIADNLLHTQHFGSDLTKGNHWLKDKVQQIIGNTSDPLSKAEKLYNYVRDHYISTSQYGVFVQENLKQVFKNEKGNVAEINLLLTAMLKFAHLNSDPVLLSTTQHGMVYQFVPMLSDLNYVVSKLNIGKKTYYLDASRDQLGFGHLPLYCYNGFACTVDAKATPVVLTPDSILEKNTSYFILNSTDDGYSVEVNKREGYYHSYFIRKAINEKSMDGYVKNFSKDQDKEHAISDFKVKHLDEVDVPLTIQYKMNVHTDASFLYIDPLFNEKTSKNPFASVNRQYPVEMPYLEDKSIHTTIMVPKGYTVAEVPKSIILQLDPSGNTFFKYIISNNGGIIMVKSQLKIGKTIYGANEYQALRTFFKQVIKKQNEKIVFKKVTS